MLFEGKALTLKLIENGIAELVFDLQGESVNKFSTLAMNELDQVLTKLESTPEIRGLIIASAKSAFIVGADITEFTSVFAKGEQAIRDHLSKNNNSFNRLEDLPYPTLVEIDGYALGGGLEMCLACDFRVATPEAKVGLPEIKLGIFPGWGGTVRLPRLVGLDVAIEWIVTAKDQPGPVAMKDGVVDAVVEKANLRKASLDMLEQAIAGKLDYQKRKQQKKLPLQLTDNEALLAFGSSEAVVKAKAGKNYPAPLAVVKTIQAHASLGRDDALPVETQYFAKLAQGTEAMALVGVFINDQRVSKKAKSLAKNAAVEIKQAAVLGAGIMGGGIAYQSALKGTPIIMKDIAQGGLDLGMAEANKLLSKRVNKGRMTPEVMAATLARIAPTLEYGNFKKVDVVVEAVVENSKVKREVLADVEKLMREDAVLCSNTSTISISYLAEALSRPENFCGMHFFNPVHAMPLVEVIRGEKTSDQTVARTVAYANTLGKKAIVVNDCPGFLVNRVLFPYFAGFLMLLRDGADFQLIDNIMEKWGWPMGPAYLADVIGIDTCVHCEKVMAEGIPQRMKKEFKAATDIMLEADRLGQKNNRGFYNYELDQGGRLQKLPSDDSYSLLKPYVAESREFTEHEVVMRIMLPMVTEMARCLEEGVVESVEEADMALIYGLGFPPFRGGVFRWLDTYGIAQFVEDAKPFKSLGNLYDLTEGMMAKAKNNEPYYSHSNWG